MYRPRPTHSNNPRGFTKSPQNMKSGAGLSHSPRPQVNDPFYEWFQEFHDFKVSASVQKAPPQQRALRHTKTFNYGESLVKQPIPSYKPSTNKSFISQTAFGSTVNNAQQQKTPIKSTPIQLRTAPLPAAAESVTTVKRISLNPKKRKAEEANISMDDKEQERNS